MGKDRKAKMQKQVCGWGGSGREGWGRRHASHGTMVGIGQAKAQGWWQGKAWHSMHVKVGQVKQTRHACMG